MVQWRPTDSRLLTTFINTMSVLETAFAAPTARMFNGSRREMSANEEYAALGERALKTACQHAFFRSKAALFADTRGIRVCVICDHAEVRISKGAMWIPLEIYRVYADIS